MAAPDSPAPVAELVATLSDGTKVKQRIPRMRACNEKGPKDKLCAGHLKRWYFLLPSCSLRIPESSRV